MAGNRENTKLNHHMAPKVIKYVVLAVIMVNVAIITYVFLGDSTPQPPLPNPNGYDDFVKAGQMIPQGYSYDYKTMTKEKLAEFVATNEAALSLVRAGLKKECHVPQNYSRDSVGEYVTNLMQMKGLALDLCAEGRLKQIEGDTNGAIDSYLNAIRFGQESSRVGVMVVKLVGIACETSASEDLRAIVGHIDANGCHEVVRTLETVDAKEDPVEENLRQEDKWARQSATTIREKIDLLLEYRSARRMKESFVGRFQTNVLRRRHMEIEFAARAYELEKGKPPQSAADLVPDYLKAVPKDPTTGKDLGLGR
jgi:hypothetical protein